MHNKNILIIDEYHFEMIRTWIEFYKNSDHIHLTIIVSDSIENQLNNYIKVNNILDVNIIVKNIIEFLKENANVKFDKIIVNTMYDNIPAFYDLYVKHFKTSSLFITLHNLKYSLQLRRVFQIYPKYRNRNQRFLHKLLKESTAIIVLSENLKKYIKRRTLFFHKKVLVIPYNIADSEFIQNRFTLMKSNKTINIVVPGIIEERRKDYLGILFYLNSIASKYRMKIVLLGTPVSDYGKKVVNYCNVMRENGVEINYYNCTVEQNEFDKVMLESDVIIAPINVKTNFNCVTEYYGKTKETGIHFDIIRYCIPAILPISLKSPKDLKEFIYPYSNYSDIEIILENKIQNKLKLTQEIIKLSKVSSNYLPSQIFINPKLKILVS